MQSIYPTQTWTVEVSTTPPVVKTYPTPSKACEAVHKALEYYTAKGNNVTITMKDPAGRWMLIEKVEQQLRITNELDLI